jgi:hypothetical protein
MLPLVDLKFEPLLAIFPQFQYLVCKSNRVTRRISMNYILELIENG